MKDKERNARVVPETVEIEVKKKELTAIKNFSKVKIEDSFIKDYIPDPIEWINFKEKDTVV